MAELPRGVPYIDLLVPPGTVEKVEDLQTRLDLVGAAGWVVRTDDGTMEHSSVPMQPLRGSTERLQIYRQQPLMQGEPLALGSQLAVEMALQTHAHVAALGVYGVYSWGLIAMEDIRWLHGLMLLDWIYNPRLDERGDLIEGDDPTVAEAAVPKKVMAFGQLWTPERSAALKQKLPEGALQTVESHQVLMMLGPGGVFDPRFWQSFSLQVGLQEIREWSGLEVAQPGGAEAGKPAPDSAPQAAAPDEPTPPAEPDDGLTPLARARLAAEQRAAELAANPETAPSEPEEPDEAVGTPVRWVETSRGPLLLLPGDRLEPSWLRDLRRGSTSGLARSERPGAELLEGWIESGAHFVTEVPSLARLMADSLPLHGAAWEAAAGDSEGYSTLACQLPRVSRVLAVRLPAGEGGRGRILVSSDLGIPVAELVEKAG